MDAALHVVVESCPLCGKEARESTVAAGITKFIFGGYSFGFVCHACGVNRKRSWKRHCWNCRTGSSLGVSSSTWMTTPIPAQQLWGRGGKPKEESTDFAKELASCLPPEIFALTDMGNAERFEWRYGGNFAFTAATGWLVYEGGVWKRDVTKTIVRAMQSTVRRIELETELVDTGSEDTDKAMRTPSSAGRRSPSPVPKSVRHWSKRRR